MAEMKLVEINSDALSKFFSDGTTPPTIELVESDGKRYKVLLKSSRFDIDSGVMDIEFEAAEVV